MLSLLKLQCTFSLRLLNRFFVNVVVAVPFCFAKGTYKKLPLITFSPAKNGTRMSFVGDQTFFGDVVNIAETLQTICWYKVIDVSLCKSHLIMFPLKRKQKGGVSSVQTAITILYQIICLKLFLEWSWLSWGFVRCSTGLVRQITFSPCNTILAELAMGAPPILHQRKFWYVNCVHHFWRCHNDHHIPSRSEE